MRAMRLAAQQSIERAPLRLERIEVPPPAAHEIVVRVAACAICRTDLHLIEGDLALHRAPIVPGHQVVGRVERAGSDARRFSVGARVGVAWLRRACGVCRFCRSDRENLCERPEFTGWTHDGGYAEYVVAPEAFAYAMPETFDDVDAAPLLCAGIIGYRALKLSRVEPGGRLAIFGFGSSAHVTLQIARARAIDVYVATRGIAHKKLAASLGAAWVGESGELMPAPADGAIIFAPAGELVPVALAALAPGGTLALAGIHMSTIPAIDYAALYEERAIQSVTANTRRDGEELLSEAARIPIRPTVTPFPLEDANRALSALKRGRIDGTGVLVTGNDARAGL
jgi:alcohol dehydrogenase, propanol-preferring